MHSKNIDKNTEQSLWRSSRLHPGTRAHLRYWPAQGSLRGELWILHGLSEHSGRYNHVAEFFAARGLDVLAPDHPGHGLSRSEGGQRAIPTLGEILAETDQALRFWREEAGGAQRPRDLLRLLMGHSMGALLALEWMRKFAEVFSQERFDRAFLSAPPLRLCLPVPAWKRVAAQALARFAPHTELSNEIAWSDLSFDEANQRAAANDPLQHGKASPALFLSLTAAAEEIFADAAVVNIPTFFAVGESDPVVDAAAIRDFASRSNLSGRIESEFWLVPQSKHEILQDRQKAELLRRSAEWFKI